MGQRVLVTAGASGIGWEIAKAFAASGASVFVGDIDAKALTAVAADRRRHGRADQHRRLRDKHAAGVQAAAGERIRRALIAPASTSDLPPYPDIHVSA